MKPQMKKTLRAAKEVFHANPGSDGKKHEYQSRQSL